MWPSAVRKILLPAHEALLRRPTPSIARRLEQQGEVTDEHIRRYHLQHIAALVQYARAASPYWHDATRSGDTPPVLTRADIARHREEMVCRGVRGKLIRHTSSGTTDDNLIFYLDRQRQAWSRALRQRALARLGVHPGEKQLHFWPHFGAGGPFGAVKDAARAVRDRLTNDPGFDLRPMTPERLAAALRYLDRYGPALIVGYPSGLYALARTRLASRASRSAVMPRYVLSTGELLYDFQRRAIESAFGAPVIEEYGAQDVGIIASEDGLGNWLVNWQHVAVEILREGRPARAGEMGEIVVTNLHSHVMPFIRYATGDVVTVTREPPSSVRRTIDRVEGRASDVLVTTDGRLYPNRALVDTLVRETGVTEFSLLQTAPDRIVCMTLREGGWAGREDAVTALLRSMLGSDLEVESKTGDAFRVLKSGKRRYVCSPVAHAMLAHDRESGVFLSRSWPQLLVGGR